MPLRSHQVFRSAAALTLFALLALPPRLAGQRAAPARMYELHVIRIPGATLCSADDVNELGTAAGTYAGPSGYRAFSWTHATGALDLGTASGLTNAIARHVNRSGIIVGVSFDSTSNYIPTVWPGAGSGFAIPTLPGSASTDARGIDNAGMVVGSSYVAGTGVGWVWDPVQGTRELGLPPGCRPMDVNGFGQVTGDEPYGTGWRFDMATSTFTGMNGGFYSGANEVNNFGRPAGWFLGPNYEPEPVLWSVNGSQEYLGSLAPFSSLLGGRASSVNDGDVVVGSSAVTSSESHAFVWDPDHGMRDLNELVEGRGPILLWSASHVSNNGWICGKAHDASAGNAEVGFVLRPR
jgi:probable HAF family extracellular repeat protein